MRLCQNALAHSALGLGLRVGNQLQPAAHGALGTAMQSAEDLEAALQTFGELIAVRASFFSLERSDFGETATISLGFVDTSSFRRTFKRWFGVTPSAYLGKRVTTGAQKL